MEAKEFPDCARIVPRVVPQYPPDRLLNKKLLLMRQPSCLAEQASSICLGAPSQLVNHGNSPDPHRRVEDRRIHLRLAPGRPGDSAFNRRADDACESID